MSATYVPSQIADISGLTEALLALNPVPVAWFSAQNGAMPDISGNGHTYTTTGAVAYSATGMNGTPAMDFSGGGRLVTDAFLGSRFDTACTVFIVSSAPGLSDNRVLLCDGGANAYWNHNGSAKTSGGSFSHLSHSADSAYLNDAGVEVFVYDGANLRYIYDKFALSNAVASTSSAMSQPLVPCTGNLGLTGALTIGGYVGGGFGWPGLISDVVMFAGAMTSRQIRNWYNALSTLRKFHAKKFVLCAGNSLTSGTGTTGGAFQSVSISGSNYPALMWAALGNTNWEVRIDAYPGRETAQMIAEMPDLGDVWCLPTASPKNICVLWELTNTLAQHQNAASAFALMIQCAADRRAAGYNKLVIPTCLPRNDGVYAGFAADHLALNTLVRNNAVTYGYTVADVAGDARLQDPADSYFYSDHVHLNDSGAAVAAGIIKTAVLLQ